MNLYKKGFPGIVIILLLSFSACNDNAPAGKSDVFIKFFGGRWGETSGGFVQINGEYVITGTTRSYYKDTINNNSAISSIYLIKTDSTGNELWSRTFSEITSTEGTDIAATPDGGFVIAGNMINGTSDIIIIRTDQDGKEIWRNYFGGSGTEEEVKDVIVTSMGEFIVTGSTTIGGNRDTYTLKLDANGNLIWELARGFEKTDYANMVIEVSDGYYALIGTSEKNKNTSQDKKNMFFVLIKQNDLNKAEAIMEETIGDLYDQEGIYLHKTGNNEFMLFGSTINVLNGKGLYAVNLKIIDNSIIQVIEKTKYNGSSKINIESGCNTVSGGYLIISSEETNERKDNFYFSSISPSGEETWNVDLPDFGIKKAEDIIEINDGHIVILGTSFFENENTKICLIKTTENGKFK